MIYVQERKELHKLKSSIEERQNCLLDFGPIGRRGVYRAKHVLRAAKSKGRQVRKELFFPSFLAIF
jgi:hypothetical protein